MSTVLTNLPFPWAETGPVNCCHCAQATGVGLESARLPRGFLGAAAFDLAEDFVWGTADCRQLEILSQLRRKDTLAFQAPSLKQIPASSLDAVMRHVQAIQLMPECSVGCAFCGVAWPADQGTEAFSPTDVASLAALFGDKFKQSNTVLYGRSDPLDYAAEDALGQVRDYPDLRRLWMALAGYEPWTSTALPRGREQQFEELLADGGVHRLSMSYANRVRVRQGAPGFEIDRVAKLLYPELQFYDVMIAPRLGEVSRHIPSFKAKDQDGPVIGGIGCFNGIVLTPGHVYNVVQGVRTRQYFTAHTSVPIDFAKFNRPLPASEVPIDQLLAQVVVEGEMRIFREGSGAGFADVLQRFFRQDGASPFMGDVLKVHNGKGETGYFGVNFLTGTAVPCRKVDYELTRLDPVTLVVLHERHLLFKFGMLTDTDPALQSLLQLPVNEASDFINIPFLTEQCQQIHRMLEVRNRLTSGSGAGAPMSSVPGSSVSLPSWQQTRDQLASSYWRDFAAPVVKWYRQHVPQ